MKKYNLTSRYVVEDIIIQIGEREMLLNQETEAMLDIIDVSEAMKDCLSKEIDTKNKEELKNRIEIVKEFVYEMVEAAFGKENADYVRTLKIPFTKLQQIPQDIMSLIENGTVEDEEVGQDQENFQ